MRNKVVITDIIWGFYHSDVIIVKSVVKSIIELKSIQNTYDKWDLEMSKYYFYFWSFKCAMDGDMATQILETPQWLNK